MVDKSKLIGVLQAILPTQAHDSVPDFADTLLDTNSISLEELQRKLNKLLEHGTISSMSDKNREQHEDSLLSLGLNNQMGDIEVRDVVKGNHITNIYYIQQQFEKAFEKQAAAVSPSERSQALRRAQFASPVLKDAQLLWVDDNPSNNIHERRVFRAFGIFVDLARSTEEAWELLGETKYDIIVSDVARGRDFQAGYLMLESLISKQYTMPVIFYTSYNTARAPKPEGSFAVTARPDELFHFVIDAVERVRL